MSKTKSSEVFSTDGIHNAFVEKYLKDHPTKTEEPSVEEIIEEYSEPINKFIDLVLTSLDKNGCRSADTAKTDIKK